MANTDCPPMLNRYLYPDFPSTDEADFLIAHNTSSISIIKIVCFIAAFVLMAYSFSDLAADPINGTNSAIIRCAVGSALLLFTMLPKRRLRVHLQTLTVLCVTLVAIGLVLVGVLLPHLRNASGALVVVPTFILLLSFNFGFLRLLFLPASLAGLLVILCFNVLSLEIQNPILLKGNLHLLIAFIIGGWVSYQLERLFRKQFVTDKVNNILLSQIYPGQILRRIKAGEIFIADESDATVVFIDIVDFTTIARMLAVSIRIGIHTGTVISGTIGDTKRFFDLWGETVNIASRMESHSENGKIATTAEVYERAKDVYEFESRDLIPVKGIGELKTYFLLGQRKLAIPTAAAIDCAQNIYGVD